MKARVTKPFRMAHKGWWEVPVGTIAVYLEEYKSRPGIYHGWCKSPRYDLPDSPMDHTIFVAHIDNLEIIEE